MKVFWLRKYWLIFLSIIATLVISLKITYVAFFSKDIRQKVDKLTISWAKRILQLVKAKCKVIDPFHVTIDRNRCYIIMSNHSSLYDIPIIFLTFPRNVRMIAKKELSRVPLWGHAMKVSEIMFIDRSNPWQARQDLEIVKQKMTSGLIPWIAPEGTRSRSGKLGVFKKGGFSIALHANAVIIPVAIVGSRNILPPKTLDFHFNQQVEVHICRPIDTNNYGDDIKRLMHDVRVNISEILEK